MKLCGRLGNEDDREHWAKGANCLIIPIPKTLVSANDDRRAFRVNALTTPTLSDRASKTWCEIIDHPEQCIVVRKLLHRLVQSHQKVLIFQNTFARE